MPILDIEIVLNADQAIRKDLAAQIADAAGEALGSGPGQTWVRLHLLDSDRYAENGGGPPGGIMPVFATLLFAHHPAREQLSNLVAELTEAIASCCERPAENIHVLVLPEGAGRTAFGGRLVE